MDNMNGMTPIGLVENEFRVTTSSVPNYQTKNLGLTQYTPNRVTSWLGNYNEDMRKIDTFSSSIGAYVEKVIEDGDEAHKQLSERINDTVSMIAVVERRIDENAAEHETIRTEIQEVATSANQKIVESEKRLVEIIESNVADTSSTLAYIQKQVSDNDAKHELAESLLNQRVHVLEDEVADVKENDTNYRQELNEVKSTVAEHGTKLYELENEVMQAAADATTANTKANANATSIASLQSSDRTQSAAIDTLQDRVSELSDIGNDVNELKEQTKVEIGSSSIETLRYPGGNPSFTVNGKQSIRIEFPIGSTSVGKNITITLVISTAATRKVIYIPNLILHFLTGDPTQNNIDCNVTLSIRANGITDSIIIIGHLSLTTAGAKVTVVDLRVNTLNPIAIMQVNKPQSAAGQSTITVF